MVHPNAHHATAGSAARPASVIAHSTRALASVRPVGVINPHRSDACWPMSGHRSGHEGRGVATDNACGWSTTLRGQATYADLDGLDGISMRAPQERRGIAEPPTAIRIRDKQRAFNEASSPGPSDVVSR